MKRITIFTIPKPFTGKEAIIQENAIKSWTQLNPSPEIIVFGGEGGVARFCQKNKLKHIPDIKRNIHGTPLLDCVFSKAKEIAENDVLCYVNADIILLQDFMQSIEANTFKDYVIVGQRWDLDIEELIDFTSGWEKQLREKIEKTGVKHPPTGSDYFIYPKNSKVGEVPAFAVGRPTWDNWMIFNARVLDVPVIDATDTATVVHQNHGYGHVPGGDGNGHTGPEGDANAKLLGDPRHIFTLLDCTHKMTPKGPEAAKESERLRRREHTKEILNDERRRRKKKKPIKGDNDSKIKRHIYSAVIVTVFIAAPAAIASAYAIMGDTVFPAALGVLLFVVIFLQIQSYKRIQETRERQYDELLHQMRENSKREDEKIQMISSEVEQLGEKASKNTERLIGLNELLSQIGNTLCMQEEDIEDIRDTNRMLKKNSEKTKESIGVLCQANTKILESVDEVMFEARKNTQLLKETAASAQSNRQAITDNIDAIKNVGSSVQNLVDDVKEETEQKIGELREHHIKNTEMLNSINSKVERVGQTLKAKIPNIGFSQEGEDAVLERILKGRKVGFYVDVGAFHPERFSNTHVFYLRGWRGINIEATPGSMREFNERRPDDINLEVAVSEKGEPMTLYAYNEPALNTFSEKVRQKLEKTDYKLVDAVEVKTMRLADILKEHLPEGQEIDFMNVDVEGLDLEVLRSNDWSRYRPEIVLVEALNKNLDRISNEQTYKYMKKQGYDLIAKTKRTLFFRDGDKK